jgi:outer membrane immunogenic protein
MNRLLVDDNSSQSRALGLRDRVVEGRSLKAMVLGVAAIVATLATPALAADMPMPVKAASPPIVWDWNEAYFGVHIGYAQADTSWCTDAFAVNCNVAGAAKDNVSQAPYGYAIGGQFGYRWQATQNFVLGAEYMVDGMAINMKSASHTDPTGTRYSAFNNLQSITGQAGLSFDRSLIYGKGGWAMTRVDFDAADTATGADVSTQQWKWVSGWTAGVGYEFLLWTHMSIGVEYDYYKFNIGSFDNILSNTGAVIGCAFCNFGRTDVQTVVARLNVKLWPWGP